MRFKGLATIIVLALAACSSASSVEPAAKETPLMVWSDLTSRPLPETPHHYAYGDDPAQMVDIWLPEGDGPHPVLLMIHGGCWQKDIADRTLMNYAAEDLRQRGIAVWNIEYRGVDEAGGGYPGTFLDVAAAADALIKAGPDFGLKTDSIVAYGHSAGGHLAAWLAARPNIVPESVLAGGEPYPISAVVISGGLADLEASAPVTLESCLAGIQDDLTGAPTPARPNVYSDTSPAELLPVSAKLISVNGDEDRIAPPQLGQGFTEKVIAAGGKGGYVEAASSGHVELISPGTLAFELQARLIAENLGVDP